MSNDTLIFRFPIQPNPNRNPPFFILNFLSQNVPESLIKANPYPVINIPPTPLFLSPLSRLGPSPPDTHPAIIISSSTSNPPQNQQLPSPSLSPPFSIIRMAAGIEGAGFWLPSEFLTDDDFLMDRENFDDSELHSDFCFPSEFPYHSETRPHHLLQV